MSINSLLEFIFSAMKRDSQLAALLVKTTRLMPSLFSLWITNSVCRQINQNISYFITTSLRLFA